MARPSMTALLALLAVAGYQHRDKLAEMLGGGSRNQGPPDEAGRRGGQQDSQQGGLAGMLGGQGGGLGGMLGGAGLGGLLSGGLRDVLDSFQKSGDGETAESWVRQGPNRELTPQQLERAIGEDTLADLQRQTGLPREELLARLTRELPKAVDGYTPEGRLPDA